MMSNTQSDHDRLNESPESIDRTINARHRTPPLSEININDDLKLDHDDNQVHIEIPIMKPFTTPPPPSSSLRFVKSPPTGELVIRPVELLCFEPFSISQLSDPFLADESDGEIVDVSRRLFVVDAETPCEVSAPDSGYYGDESSPVSNTTPDINISLIVNLSGSSAESGYLADISNDDLIAVFEISTSSDDEDDGGVSGYHADISNDFTVDEDSSSFELMGSDVLLSSPTPASRHIIRITDVEDEVDEEETQEEEQEEDHETGDCCYNSLEDGHKICFKEFIETGAKSVSLSNSEIVTASKETVQEFKEASDLDYHGDNEHSP